MKTKIIARQNKGGMHDGENYIQTLNRELKEELGYEFEYKILEQSKRRIVYDWDEELQKRKGFLGQVRTNYWLLGKNKKITIPKDELKDYIWVKENDIIQTLIQSRFPKEEYEKFRNEWLIIKEKYIDLFN